MSAILIHAGRNAIHVASDAGTWNTAGDLAAIGSKIHKMDQANAVIVTRGDSRVGDLLVKRSGMFSFSMIARHLGQALRRAVADTPNAGTCEVFVAGWHEVAGDLQAWHAASTDKSVPAFTPSRVQHCASPLPFDGYTFAGFAPDQVAELFEAMRNRIVLPVGGGEPRCVVAGFCELATITRDGMTRKVVVQWDDAPVVVPSGNPHQVEAEEMLFKQFDPVDLQDRTIIIDSNINNINLRNIHDEIFPAITEDDLGTGGVTVTFIVNGGVIVGSANTSTPACDVGNWLAGFTPLLRVVGRIQGHGGNGGNEADAGFDGGPALFTRHDLDIDVDAGEIWGGAGGGGGGSDGGGGGGAGQLPGSGGLGEQSQFNGQPGTTEAGGNGGGGGSPGGDGGDPGQPGGSTFVSGGAAGAAIDGISFVTVIDGPGDIRGGQIG